MKFQNIRLFRYFLSSKINFLVSFELKYYLFAAFTTHRVIGISYALNILAYPATEKFIFYPNNSEKNTNKTFKHAQSKNLTWLYDSVSF